MSYPIKSQTVLDLAGWAPTGDSIDHGWYRHIRRKNKPYYQAILLLGRITYMYRPVDVLDPRNQLVIGRAQKFEADLWQQSRRSLATFFGMSMNDVDAALEALKHIGVIWTELRTITVKGQRMSNTMYIGLNVLILQKISTPMVLQTHSYTSVEGELSVSSTIAMGLQGNTNTEITKKITQKSRSIAAVRKSGFSAKRTTSQAVREAIAALPPVLQRDAFQIAQEEAKAGDEVIASNFLLIASRKGLTGGLLRSAVRQDYAASQRKQVSDQEVIKHKILANKEAIEHQRTVEEGEYSKAALEWCASDEGKQYQHMFELLPVPILSEADRESRERLQRDKLNRQRQELLNAGLLGNPHDLGICPQCESDLNFDKQPFNG
jgi:hypothetical protein